MLAAMAVPSLFVLWHRRELKRLALWVIAAALSMLVVAGLAIVLTGHASAYLGVERMGVPVFDPQPVSYTHLTLPTTSP